MTAAPTRTTTAESATVTASPIRPVCAATATTRRRRGPGRAGPDDPQRLAPRGLGHPSGRSSPSSWDHATPPGEDRREREQPVLPGPEPGEGAQRGQPDDEGGPHRRADRPGTGRPAPWGAPVGRRPASRCPCGARAQSMRYIIPAAATLSPMVTIRTVRTDTPGCSATPADAGDHTVGARPRHPAQRGASATAGSERLGCGHGSIVAHSGRLRPVPGSVQGRLRVDPHGPEPAAPHDEGMTMNPDPTIEATGPAESMASANPSPRRPVERTPSTAFAGARPRHRPALGRPLAQRLVLGAAHYGVDPLVRPPRSAWPSSGARLHPPTSSRGRSCRTPPTDPGRGRHPRRRRRRHRAARPHRARPPPARLGVGGHALSQAGRRCRGLGHRGDERAARLGPRDGPEHLRVLAVGRDRTPSTAAHRRTHHHDRCPALGADHGHHRRAGVQRLPRAGG